MDTSTLLLLLVGLFKVEIRHLKPLIFLSILGRLGKTYGDNLKMMAVYMSAQFLGAFLASGLACLVYFDKIDWKMDPVEGTCLLATCAQRDYDNSAVN